MARSILVDANVLLDILTADPDWLEWSSSALRTAHAAGTVIVNPIVCAEIAPVFDFDWGKLDRWLSPAFFVREDLPFDASVIAASSHAIYRKRGGARHSPLPDFYIGAHAQARGHELLTRDVSRYRTYFPSLSLISPRSF